MTQMLNLYKFVSRCFFSTNHKDIGTSNFRSNSYLKKLSTLIIFMVPLYFIMFYFEILQDYLYILEFVLARLILVLLVLMLFQILLNLPITRDFHEELQIFNSDPKNMPFVVLLRKYHFQLFLLGYLNFSLATTYFVENFMVSYVLGIVAFCFCCIIFNSICCLYATVFKASNKKLWLHG